MNATTPQVMRDQEVLPAMRLRRGRAGRMVAVVAIAVALTAAVQAQIVVDPISATSNIPYYASGGDVRGPATKLINGSGLSDASIVETGDAVPVSWPTSGISHSTGFLGTTTSGRFLFDLGAVYDVTGLHIWNSQEAAGDHPEGNVRGIRNTTIYYSITALDVNTGGGTNGGAYEMPKAPGATYAGDTVTFGSTLTARYIIMDVANSWGSVDYMGAEEIRFIAVPEPATGILLGGAAACLLLVRRRRGAK